MAAHFSAVIIEPSSIVENPCDFPSLVNEALRILDAVNPGHTHITFTPLSSNSVRRDSKKPCMANFEALYPVLPGNPRYPATDDTPTMLPFRSIMAFNAYFV